MNHKQAAAQQARERLIEAGLKTLNAMGAAFTLDAVAKEAGMSKGGLLHHFASKDALLEEIIQHLYNQFEQEAQRYFDADEDKPGRWLRAYIHASFTRYPIAFNISLIASLYVHHEQMVNASFRQDYQRWKARLSNDGIPFARANVIRLACDAYLTQAVVEAIPEDSEETNAIIEELIRMTLS